jgi:hypothetical protein
MITRTQFLFFTIGLGVFIGFILANEPGWVPLLDGANLIFHEAGHPIFGLLGETPGLYGGTLGQLGVPLIAAIAFWQQSSRISAAICGVWFFENFFNIARYIGDARAQVLPLVGGGEHDWYNILTRWDALALDTAIAHGVIVAGWTGIALVWMWAGWQWWNHPAPSGTSGT